MIMKNRLGAGSVSDLVWPFFLSAWLAGFSREWMLAVYNSLSRELGRPGSENLDSGWLRHYLSKEDIRLRSAIRSLKDG